MRLPGVVSGINRLAALCVLAVSPFVARAAAPVSAWVSIAPQRSLVEALGGERVSVEVLVRPRERPDQYSPGARQMARLAKADVYFGIGVPVEKRLFPRIRSGMPGVRVVPDVRANSEVSAGTGTKEGHGHGHAHSHGGTDPHVWMDPLALLPRVERMRAVLAELDPEGSALYAATAECLRGRLRALHADIRRQLAPFEGRPFFINHPSLGHFAERYGLVQRSIEHSGAPPSARRMAGLIDEARRAGVGTIFAQPGFGRTSAGVLARQIGARVVEVDPLAEDYFRNMRRIAEALARSFGE